MLHLQVKYGRGKVLSVRSQEVIDAVATALPPIRYIFLNWGKAIYYLKNSNWKLLKGNKCHFASYVVLIDLTPRNTMWNTWWARKLFHIWVSLHSCHSTINVSLSVSIILDNFLFWYTTIMTKTSLIFTEPKSLKKKWASYDIFL